jgi:uncharacterized repeat protein (TIGR01451 family)
MRTLRRTAPALIFPAIAWLGAACEQTDTPTEARPPAVMQILDDFAGLSLTKHDDPDPVSPGAELRYLLRVANSGPADAIQVKLIDMVPAQTTFQSVIAEADWICSTPLPGGTGAVICQTDRIFAGSSALIVLTVQVSPAATGVIVNEAAVETETPDNPVNNTATTTTTVEPVAEPSADVSVTKADEPDPVAPGNKLTYTLTVTNNGPSNVPAEPSLASLVLNDVVPAQTTFQSIMAPAGWTCSTVPSGGTRKVVCATPDEMVAGSSATFTLVVTVDATAMLLIENTVVVGVLSVRDPNTFNNVDTEVTTVGPPPPPPPPPPPQSGKVTGGGQVPVTGGTASFGFTAKVENGVASGNLSYTNHATGAQLDCTVTGLTFGPTPNSAKFSGRDCKAPKSAGGSFEAEVEDNGEPGKKNMDKFTITYAGKREGGTLRSGNIQIQK